MRVTGRCKLVQFGGNTIETLPRSATGVEIQRSGMRKHFVLRQPQASLCRTAEFDPARNTPGGRLMISSRVRKNVVVIAETATLSAESDFRLGNSPSRRAEMTWLILSSIIVRCPLLWLIPIGIQRV